MQLLLFIAVCLGDVVVCICLVIPHIKCRLQPVLAHKATISGGPTITWGGASAPKPHLVPPPENSYTIFLGFVL